MTKPRLQIKGKTVFIVALLTIGLTFITVYLTGVNFNRSLSTNLYISLGIIAIVFFSFLSFSLFYGTKLINDYPKFKSYQPGVILDGTNLPSFGFDGGDGIGGILVSVLVWIAMAILMVILLLVFEALFWLSLFIIFASLYWLFIRALKLVFNEVHATKGNLLSSILIAGKYTVLYTGWFFLIAFAVQLLG
ncbi:MAG: hypothetical protein AAGA64_12500 [Bacteroidota bacterium]